MYGKLFAQMYDGTLATKGPWQALVTFQQLVILADREGIVDMTAESIARRTTIPPDIIATGIEALEQPDEESRSPAESGRRIVRLSDSREWGWKIVNYEHYRNMRSQDERREYMRLYQQKRRAQQPSTDTQQLLTNVNNVNNVNQSSKQYAVSSKQKQLKAASQKQKQHACGYPGCRSIGTATSKRNPKASDWLCSKHSDTC